MHHRVSRYKYYNFHCEVCHFSKHHRVSFPFGDDNTSHPFTLVHTNVWEPFKIPIVLELVGLFVLLMNVHVLLGCLL